MLEMRNQHVTPMVLFLTEEISLQRKLPSLHIQALCISQKSQSYLQAEVSACFPISRIIAATKNRYFRAIADRLSCSLCILLNTRRAILRVSQNNG